MTPTKLAYASIAAVLLVGLPWGVAVASGTPGPTDGPSVADLEEDAVNVTDTGEEVEEATGDTGTTGGLDGTDDTEPTAGEATDDVEGTVAEETGTVEETAESTGDALEDATEADGIEDGAELGAIEDTMEDASILGALESPRSTAGSSTRGVNETTAAGNAGRAPPGSEPAAESWSEAGSDPPSTVRPIDRSSVDHGPGGEDDGSTPTGITVGLVALLIGVSAHGGPLTANGTPEALLRGLASHRRVSPDRASLRSRPWRIFPLFRYSRFDDSDPLEHEDRRELYRLIRENPGTNLSTLADDAGVPLSTARHHLRVLQREGLVDDWKAGGKRRFVPRGTAVDDRFAALDDPATVRVLDALERHGPASVSGLAEELDRDPSTVTHHLQALEEAALVERRREGRTVVNHLTPEARRALDDGGDVARGDDHLEFTD